MGFSQSIQPDTTKSTTSASKGIKLTPLTIEIENVKYKAFTFPQTRILMKELVTLEYLNTLNNVKSSEIDEYKLIVSGQEKQIDNLEKLDKNNQIIIGNQTTVIKNKDSIIKIKDSTIKKKNRTLLFGGIISVAIIGALLFK